MIFKFGELFCGPGGLSLGAIQAVATNGSQVFKVKPLWANDYDSDTCKTYARNIHPDNPKAVICAPVQNLDLDSLEPIDALAFGFPCNDFSIVGEQKGLDGKFGGLFSYGVKVLDRFKPKWFFAENVGGLQSANEGKAFAHILEALQNAGDGYVITPNLYKFEQYGVPQYRHRIVIIGIRKDLGLKFKVPAPTTPRPQDFITVRTAFENPPISKDAPNNEITVQSAVVIERLKHIPAGQNAWYDGLPEHLRLNVKGARLSQIYKRLHPDKPSYTMTGSGGGGTHGYHWSEPRALTNRERARIQTFPDDFIFEGSKESVRKQIGMAVPVKGAKAIVEAVLKTFAGISYESVFPNISLEERARKIRLPRDEAISVQTALQF